MASPVQALDGGGRQNFYWRSWQSRLCVLTCVVFSGCGSAGFSLESAVPDTSIVTGSISREPATASDSTRQSDEVIVRAAVSAAIVEEVNDGIGWANADTGSRGTINGISENRDTGFLCRRFTTTRESFEGVHLYQGEACLGPARMWMTKSFDRIQ